LEAYLVTILNTYFWKHV